MKIAWLKDAPSVLGGYVGKVKCFEITKENDNQYELICELPHVADNIYGRLITHHNSAKQASKEAQRQLRHWFERLKTPKS